MGWVTFFWFIKKMAHLFLQTRKEHFQWWRTFKSLLRHSNCQLEAFVSNQRCLAISTFSLYTLKRNPKLLNHLWPSCISVCNISLIHFELFYLTGPTSSALHVMSCKVKYTNRLFLFPVLLNKDPFHPMSLTMHWCDKMWREQKTFWVWLTHSKWIWDSYPW